MADTRENVTKALAAEVRRARKARELSQLELARKADVPRARIKRLEGAEMATIERAELRRIAQALGMSLKPSSRGQSRPARKKKAPTRAQMRKLLGEHGMLDLTLRDLLA